MKTPEAVIFSFSGCPVFRSSLAVSLVGMCSYLYSIKCTVIFQSLKPEIKSIYRALQYPYAGNVPISAPVDSEIIPIRHDLINDEDGVIEFLKEQWIGKSKIKMSEDLSNAIIGKVWEVYTNAFEHSKTEFGVVTHSQHENGQSQITIADFGHGIPKRVKDFRPECKDDGDALKWAFTLGNTTQIDAGIPRGLGLGLLKEFARANGGSIDVFSGLGRMSLQGSTETYGVVKYQIPGVLFRFAVKNDEREYAFAHEIDHFRPLF